MEGFTRQEALALTKTTSSRLAYLDRTGIVVPEKFGSPKKPTAIYSFNQVLQIRAINELRQQVSLQTIRKIVKFLEKSGFDTNLWNKHLVVVHDEVFFVLPDWSDLPGIMKVASRQSKGLGQFVLVVLPPIADVVESVLETAINSKIINFESFEKRARAASLIDFESFKKRSAAKSAKAV